MDQVQRVVVRDKDPLFVPELVKRPANRVAVAAAGVAVCFQLYAVVQVVKGRGTQLGWFDHVSFAAVAAVWLLLGCLVFVQRRADRSGRLFLLSSACGSIYLGMGTLSGYNLFDALAYTAGALLFPPFLLSFTRSFGASRAGTAVEALVYVPAIALVWPMAQDFANGKQSLAWRSALLMVVVYLVASIVQTWISLRAAPTPEVETQSRALLCGLVAGTVPGTLLILGPLAINGKAPVTTVWQPVLILLFLISMSYAVLLFELSDANLILRRSIVYGVLTLAIVVAYAILGTLLTVSRATVTSVGGGVSFVLVSVLIGAAFIPIRRGAVRFVEWLIYGKGLDRWALLQEVSARLTRVMQPRDVYAVLVEDLVTAMHLRGASVWQRNDKSFFEVTEPTVPPSRNAGISYLEAHAVESALGQPPQPLLIVHARPFSASRRVEAPSRIRVLDTIGAALSVPLVTRRGLTAVLCLQPKYNHDAFDADDLALLAPVIRQASVSLDNALLFQQLEEKVDELRLAYKRIANEQEAERARLARELHDGTAQELAGLLTLAAAAERQMEGSNAPTRATLHRLRDQAQEAYEGVRRASHALRPAMLNDFGLAPTLSRYLAQFSEHTGIRVDYDPVELYPLPDDIELALFRVVQECMENVRKHSGARKASVRFRRSESNVILQVSDEGKGPVGGAGPGIGIAGMRDRLEAIGGTLTVLSEPGTGMYVEVRVPIPEGLPV